MGDSQKKLNSVIGNGRQRKAGAVKIFACNSNRKLAQDIAANLGLELGKSEVTYFSDGEIYSKIDETVRDADVYIIQSTCTPVNDNLMELLIVADAMKRASAGTINAVMPYFGYARQDRKSRARDPISAKLVANLIFISGVDRIITMDLHCAQIQGFFDIPVDHLLGSNKLADYYLKKFERKMEDIVLVSPDLGSVSRARAFASKLDIPIAIVDKRRPKANMSEVMNIIGNVAGKTVILADDMIDTAGTLCNAAEAMIKAGANEVYACCTHAVLSGSAIERIEASSITELVVLDTIPLNINKRTDKIKVLSVADVFSEAIDRIHNGYSVSELFV